MSLKKLKKDIELCKCVNRFADFIVSPSGIILLIGLALALAIAIRQKK